MDHHLADDHRRPTHTTPPAKPRWRQLLASIAAATSWLLIFMASPTSSTPTEDDDGPPTELILLSTTSSGSADGQQFADEDIISYDSTTDTWDLFFDGSDVSLGSADLNGFHVVATEPETIIHLTFEKPRSVPGVGWVDDSDVVTFTGTTGAETSGTFERLFDGSDISLTGGGEPLDALSLQEDAVLFSTTGNLEVPAVSGKDEDLVAFASTSTGDATAGSFTLAFDGSDVSLSNEDVVSASLSPTTGELFFTVTKALRVPNPESGGDLIGDDNDIFVFTGTTGSTTEGTISLLLDTEAAGLGNESIDGLHILTTDPATSESIVWNESSLARSLLPGTRESASLGFTTEAETETLSALVSGAASALVSVDTATLAPTDGSSYTLDATVEVPSGTEPGVYTGTLQLSGRESVFEPALDIAITVNEPSSTVIPDGPADPSKDSLMMALPDTMIVRGEIVVGLELETADPEAAIVAIATETGATFRGSVGASLLYQLDYSTETVDALTALADELTARPNVEFASLNVVSEDPLSVIPDDTEWDTPWDVANPGGNNWGLEYIDAPAAWDLNTGSADVKVAIIDGDFDEDHTDLNDNVDLINGRGPSSWNGHGTHVAGTACAEGNNANGITGVAWDCGLLLYGYGTGSVRAHGAMVDAVDDGADIANMSLQFVENDRCGTPGTALSRTLVDDTNDILGRAMIYAELQERDVLWVMAAGNECRDTEFASPASLVDRFPTNVVTVASTDADGSLSAFSNFGDLVTVAAPGNGIYSTVPRSPCFLGFLFCNDQYEIKNGTSMAAPHVTGLAALVRSANPSFTASDIKGCILASAVNSGTPVPGHDFSIINAPAAIRCESVVELPDEVDLVIGVDLTGSMGGVVAQAKAEATQLVQGLEAAAPTTDFRFALVSYEDYPAVVNASSCGLTNYSATYGDASAGDEPFRIDEVFTASSGAIQTAVDGLTLKSGADGPEAYTRVLWELGQSDTGATLGFRPDALKLFVNFADNIPHDPDLDEGVVSPTLGLADTGLDLGRNGVLDCGGDDIDLQDDALPAMSAAGVRLLHVDSSRSTAYEPYWRLWSSETGGAYTSIDGDGSTPLTEVVIELLQLIPDMS